MEAFAVGPDYDDALTAPVDDTTQTGARCEPPPDPPEPVRARRASAPLDAGARYQLGDEIGRGGMGEVVAARDLQIGRDVAIKRLHAGRISPVARARFLREARIQARLEHPAIPPVHELGEDDDGRPFFAMKKLAGITLADVLRDPAQHAAFPRQRLLRAFVDVCHAIELAHSRGVVHRDLKPANVLLGDFGEVYVLDWGVARILDEIDPTGDPERTGAGVALGTPGYMAPEQVRGEPDLDARADVYALGCVLFEIVTGQRLHPRGHAGMRSALAGVDARPSTHRDGVAPELDELCQRATAVERAHRLGSARALGDAVERYLDGDRDLAHRNELAREHLAVAHAALAGADPEETRRCVAMREAGQALALDPTLRGAAELVGRLMLEPPAETPPVVAVELGELDAGEARRQSRVALGIHVAYLALAPLFYLLGIRDLPYLGALAGVAAISIVCQAARCQDRAALHPGIILSDVLLVALLARMFTPFLVAPGVAAVTVMATALHPGADKRRVIVACGALQLAAVLGMWLAEALGVISTTMSVVHGTIILQSPLAGIEAFPTVAALFLYAGALVVIAGGLAHQTARAGREPRRQLHVQAWQLRQLVSSEPR